MEFPILQGLDRSKVALLRFLKVKHSIPNKQPTNGRRKQLTRCENNTKNERRIIALKYYSPTASS